MNDVIFYLERILKKDDIVVVGTSGGPDSMCLLHLLSELKFNVKVIVAHVNHKLRKESEIESDFVKDYALKHNFIFEYMEIKEYNHDNLESEARCKRYDFFNKLCVKYKANFLMTAHHGDDLVETILMRIVRGSSLNGYGGFRRESDMDSYKLIRPLIEVTKADILKYMDNNNYKYYVDKSNYSLDYTRNRYRADVLPFLKAENPLVHLKFLKFSSEIDKASKFIDAYVKELIINLKSDKGYKIKELIKLDEFLLEKVIEYILYEAYDNDLYKVGYTHIKLIIKLIFSDKSNGYVNLPNNYSARKDYNYLSITKLELSGEFYYVLSDTLNLDTGIIKKISSSEIKNNYVLRLNSKHIKLPIIVRSRHNGDKIEVKNLGGTKKVKDILIDEKVKMSQRNNFPIVTDSNDVVLWLPGVKKSKFDVERDGIYDIILSYEEE